MSDRRLSGLLALVCSSWVASSSTARAARTAARHSRSRPGAAVSSASSSSSIAVRVRSWSARRASRRASWDGGPSSDSSMRCQPGRPGDGGEGRWRRGICGRLDGAVLAGPARASSSRRDVPRPLDGVVVGVVGVRERGVTRRGSGAARFAVSMERSSSRRESGIELSAERPDPRGAARSEAARGWSPSAGLCLAWPGSGHLSGGRAAARPLLDSVQTLGEAPSETPARLLRKPMLQL